MSAPTAVVFDLFGVIACAQSPTGRAEILAAAGAPAGRAEEFWRAYWELRPSYDRGRLSAPDYWRSVAGTVDTTFTRARIAELIAADCGSWRAVDPQMLHLLDILARSGLRLGLLSNIPPELADEFLQRHAWLGHLAVLGFSCRIGHIKPEPATILFVDDRDENVRAARACGMQGHLFTDAATSRRASHPGRDTIRHRPQAITNPDIEAPRTVARLHSQRGLAPHQPVRKSRVRVTTVQRSGSRVGERSTCG